jgi:microcystin-dependent protein
MADNYTDTTDTDFKEEPYNIDTGKPLSAVGVRNALHTKEAALPVGTILAISASSWTNTSAVFKSKWQVCDGTGGTPDLRGRFLRGGTASDTATGGTDSQNITLSISNIPSHNHGVTDSGHSHAGYIGQNPVALAGVVRDFACSGNYEATYKQSISKSITNISVQNTGGGQPFTVNTVPKYFTVIYIMKIA